ncbi:outer membrane protein transport protein [Helicobacter sp. 11S02629-2]|uniref:OmpP1/FadL family transporter n=1 Tax=Helicobacter sp. 11S02629-2 TaxID=1476195 RepID=UPI000BA6176A|nr:outer membrane protein transport protein [Helicobacter sp. 11S02629-2]PAF44097.1 hypothetical protein BKH40_06410 [Helicobacter sp. 11S02629-2]
MLRKVIICGVASLSVMFANGFKIQEQSLNGTALSSAYVAGARGADASYYNPANMGFDNDYGENKNEFEMAFSIINIPGFSFQVPTTNRGLTSITHLTYKGIAQTGGALLNGINSAFNSNINVQNLIPSTIALQHTMPDNSYVQGFTGDTNFFMPKFFYKSKTYNGFTFGASFIAPSGLALQWQGKGGEFLQDIFIFLVELSTPISYTYNDRISFSIAPRILYGMGKFNNTVYVPLGTAEKPGNTPSFDPSILQSLPNGLIPSSMVDSLEMVRRSPVLLGILGLPQGASQLDVIKSMVSNIQTSIAGTARVDQRSDGSDLGFGYRAALSVRVADNGMFSVVYSSPVSFDFKGNLDANTIIGGPVGSVRMQTTLDLFITMPEIITLAYAHQIGPVRLEAVYERTFWSRGRKFDIKFDADHAKFSASEGSVAQSFSQDQLKGMINLADFSAVAMGVGWRDTNHFRLGATYIGRKLRLMASVAYEQSPVQQDMIGIPDSDGFMVGFGAKYNFRGFDIGVALSQTFKQNRDSIYSNPTIGQLRIATASLGYRW